MKDSTKLLELFLGAEGTQALTKTADNMPVLAAVIVPQILSTWLDQIEGFQGELLGNKVNIAKSEQGYTGNIQIGSNELGFVNSTNEYVTAAITVMLGLNKALNEVNPTKLKKLNKAVDVLVRNTLSKADRAVPHRMLPAYPIPPNGPEGPVKPSNDPTPRANQAREPNPNSPITEPVQPLGKLKIPKLKIKKSEISSRCSICMGHQFDANSNLTGCLCIKSLLKSVDVSLDGADYVLSNTNNLDLDDLGFVTSTLTDKE